MINRPQSKQYHGVFANRHTVLPVLHVEDEDQALRNAAIAREHGCDGVFLINHGMPYEDLLAIHGSVSRHNPGWWIGVNCLDLQPTEVFARLTPEIAGVWVDNAMVDERAERQVEAERIRDARLAAGWDGLYFGGVAFKYQRRVEDLARAARLAAPWMDVVTTSGPGTGKAADAEKIRAMKQALGETPLAIASGITSANVQAYLEHADCFLVATGISTSFTELDPTKVEALVSAVRSYGIDGVAGSESSSQRDWLDSIRSICFVCEWNEGRSVHLELGVRHRLRGTGTGLQLSSCGLSQGGGINRLRRRFLEEAGVPRAEAEGHRSTVLGDQHASADLLLVAETHMRERVLALRPELRGRVMTVRGFVAGHAPDDEPLSAEQAHIEDADGHSPEEKLALYRELEELADAVAARLRGE